jgi:hypothetical protein
LNFMNMNKTRKTRQKNHFTQGFWRFSSDLLAFS